MSIWIIVFPILISLCLAQRNFSLSSNPKCQSLSDCPNGFENCSEVSRLNEKRCIKDMKQICKGGKPDFPIKSCNRQRDCTDNLLNFEGWCDIETKFCCQVNESSREVPFCPDRITPLYGQEKCSEVKENEIYSGKSEQKGGFCYKGYSCPPKITRPHDLRFGSKTYRTNMDCWTKDRIQSKFEFMFCHNETGNLWIMGQYNVNGDEVTKHWTQCETNKCCEEGLVCVKEDLCRYRCYGDPTLAVNYNWIVVEFLSMFFVPFIFLIVIIVLTVKYLD